MIEIVIIRLGRVGVNVVLIDVIKYAVFFLKASLIQVTENYRVVHPLQNTSN